MSFEDEYKDAKLESKKDFLNYKYKVLPVAQNKKLKKDFLGRSKSIFVGEYGYPHVNLGILSSEHYFHNDDTRFWIDNNWKISQIANSRVDLINSKKQHEVKQGGDYLNEVQEIALSKLPTDVEVNLEKVPTIGSSFSQFHLPHGPSAELSKLKLGENPHIPYAVEKVVSDKDLRADLGLGSLYEKGFNKDYLVQAFSSGSLGIGENRKIVPTKWSITAVDDTLGKQIIHELRDYAKTGNLVFSGNYMGNFFLILCFEGQFSYELFEFFRDKPDYTTDYESIEGRKNYASETAGGYYAARISVLEKLSEMKKQTQVLALRFITDDYYMPLGVWVVRNAVAEAMKNQMEFGSEELMLNFAIAFAKKKFNRDISWIKTKSKLLVDRRTIKRLSDFS